MEFDFSLFTQVNGWAVLILFAIECFKRFSSMALLHIGMYVGCIVMYACIEFFYSYADKQFYNRLGIIASTPHIWSTLVFAAGSCAIINLVQIYVWPLIYPNASTSVVVMQYLMTRK